MTNHWDDLDVAYCHVAPTADGGAVAVALVNKVELDPNSTAGVGVLSVEKTWKFKRSPDQQNWPSDEEAVTITELPASTIAHPVSIRVDGGTLSVSDGYTKTFISRSLGAPGSWAEATT